MTLRCFTEQRRPAVPPETQVTGRPMSLRCSESSGARTHVHTPTPLIMQAIAERLRTARPRIDVVALPDVTGWHVDPAGNLRHDSGRFYTIEGLDVLSAPGRPSAWSQPIIVQPEIGILGLLVKEFHGVLHCLVQIKMEPGNITTFQLSPTVQATRSNYTGVHRGRTVPYLEYFTEPARGRTITDVLQSEQGSWFLGKRNRNMIVEVTEDVPVHDSFCWMTIGQLHEALGVANLVNMDTRTVLSHLPFDVVPERSELLDEDSFLGALARSRRVAPRTRQSLTSWFISAKATREISRQRAGLRGIEGWTSVAGHLRHSDGRFFSVLGVRVETEGRETTSWSQPMIAPVGPGIIAFITKQIDGVLHVLLQARSQAGTFDVVEMGPTVQCRPGNYPDSTPPFLADVVGAPAGAVRFDVVQSEEGGRFYHATNRCLIVEADAGFATDVPDGFAWSTLHEISALIEHGHYFNVEARCLLACLNSLWRG